MIDAGVDGAQATCADGRQNGDETGIDCGGTCGTVCPPAHCDNGVRDADEEDVDCGGGCSVRCTNDPLPTCSDGMKNQNETGVDCGGVCQACAAVATCEDRVQNQGETGVDCGGPCSPCPPEETCADKIQNQNETGVDCGGVCDACPPQTGCHPSAKRLFVTSRKYQGSLTLAGNAATGLEGGDNLCQYHADEAGLGGKWVAWLSTSSVDAIDRIPDVGPWYFVDQCTEVFASKAAISIEGPKVEIRADEHGAQQIRSAWTGTDRYGKRDYWHCSDWATNSSFKLGIAAVHYVSLPNTWTEGSTHDCDFTNALICFEK